MPTLFTIYALTQPETGEVRYVGKTFRTPEERLVEHWHESRTEEHHRARWLRSLARKNLEPGVMVLEVVSEGSENEAERRWIAHHAGPRLTNGTEGGDGGRVGPEGRAKQSASMKGRKSGFAGRKHSAETRAKLSAVNRRRYAEGSSPFCDPEHQRKADARSRENASPEQRAAYAEHCRRIARLGAEARWGKKQ